MVSVDVKHYVYLLTYHAIERPFIKVPVCFRYIGPPRPYLRTCCCFFRYIGPPRPYLRTCLFQIHRASKTLSIRTCLFQIHRASNTLSTYLFVSDTSASKTLSIRTCFFQIHRASNTLSTYLFVSDTSGIQHPIYVPVCFRHIGPPRPYLPLARGLGRGDRRRLVVDRRYPSNRHAVG